MSDDAPICPHCQHVERDAWEINFGPGLDGDADVTCNACGEEYLVTRIVAVSYRCMAKQPQGKDSNER